LGRQPVGSSPIPSVKQGKAAVAHDAPEVSLPGLPPNFRRCPTGAHIMPHGSPGMAPASSLTVQPDGSLAVNKYPAEDAPALDVALSTFAELANATETQRFYQLTSASIWRARRRGLVEKRYRSPVHGRCPRFGLAAMSCVSTIRPAPGASCNGSTRTRSSLSRCSRRRRPRHLDE
jgi:hypothetical protein